VKIFSSLAAHLNYTYDENFQAALKKSSLYFIPVMKIKQYFFGNKMLGILAFAYSSEREGCRVAKAS